MGAPSAYFDAYAIIYCDVGFLHAFVIAAELRAYARSTLPRRHAATAKVRAVRRNSHHFFYSAF